MNDSALRELCNRFFNAVETGDIATVADLYHPEMKFWINLTDTERSREDNLAALEKGKSVHRRRSYDDRRINTFATGFVCQFSVNIVRHDGSKNSVWAALVARCKDGKIIRIDEYLDSSKSGQPQAERQ